MLFQVSGTQAYASDCPRIITLAEWDAISKEDNKEDQKDNEEKELGEEQEEAKEAAVEGEMLVLRRVLSNRRGVEDERRENIFHSHCTIEGNVCLLRIDIDSYANILSLL